VQLQVQQADYLLLVEKLCFQIDRYLAVMLNYQKMDHLIVFDFEIDRCWWQELDQRTRKKDTETLQHLLRRQRTLFLKIL